MAAMVEEESVDEGIFPADAKARAAVVARVHSLVEQANKEECPTQFPTMAEYMRQVGYRLMLEQALQTPFVHTVIVQDRRTVEGSDRISILSRALEETPDDRPPFREGQAMFLVDLCLSAEPRPQFWVYEVLSCTSKWGNAESELVSRNWSWGSSALPDSFDGISFLPCDAAATAVLYGAKRFDWKFEGLIRGEIVSRSPLPDFNMGMKLKHKGFSETAVKAIKSALTEKITCIRASEGTGRVEVIREIVLQLMDRNLDAPVLVCAESAESLKRIKKGFRVSSKRVILCTLEEAAVHAKQQIYEIITEVGNSANTLIPFAARGVNRVVLIGGADSSVKKSDVDWTKTSFLELNAKDAFVLEPQQPKKRGWL